MTLAALVLASMLGLRPAADRADLDRYVAIADAVAAETADAPLFDAEPDAEAEALGLPDAGVAMTAVLVDSVYAHESGFRESVRRCRWKGDHGRSIGLGQIMRGAGRLGFTEAETCASDRIQARQTLAALRRAKAQCRCADPAWWLRAYASGDGGRDSTAARELADVFFRARRRAGLDVVRGKAVWN